MSSPVPVTPGVIRWARERAGLSVEEVVQMLDVKSVNSATLASWETGSGGPTYPQLETLAYDIYKRPLALFFFPEPPEEETLKQSFRTLPEQELSQIPPRLRLLIRQAQFMRLNLHELYEGAHPSDRPILRDLKFTADARLPEMVSSVRRYLQVDLDTQFGWGTREQAFKCWRGALEDAGVSVFKDAFKYDAVSGFCLYDEEYPIIYVNNSTSASRQTFTLFHELAHLLFATGCIHFESKDYTAKLQGDDRQIEILCNRFAGAFLVPDDDFDSRIAGYCSREEEIQRLADLYCVSREVVLRKLVDRGLVSPEQYSHKVDEWGRAADSASGEGGGNYYFTKKAYLGERYLRLVFGQLFQNRISVELAADYLGVKVRSMPGMEALLYHGGGPA